MRHTAVLLAGRPAGDAGPVELHTAPPNRVYTGEDATPARARADGAHYVALLGPHVNPVRDDWLSAPAALLDGGAAVVVTADRGPAAPGFLMTTVDVVGSGGTGPGGERARQALLARAEAAGLAVGRLERSSPELPGLPDEIYGDVLHDGEANRAPVLPEQRRLHAEMLRAHREEYLAWRRGGLDDRRVVFVLGMHRSGTSSLTAGLERCGLHLGDVVRRTLSDQPHGSFERLGVVDVNDRLLAAAGGSWKDPPAVEPAASPDERAAIAGIVAGLEADGPSGLKDPRLLLTLDPWTSAASDPVLVGAFRHPTAVARSLLDRDAIPMERGYELWSVYNEHLVRLHRQHGFPLVEFDLSDRVAYGRRVIAVASELGLYPDLASVVGQLERPAKGRAPAADTPVPPSCQALYAYLRTHRDDAGPEEGSFAALLADWASCAPLPADRERRRDVDSVLFSLGRRVPRPVRNAVWRAWYRIRS